MSTPSSTTEPESAAIGISSCIRLRMRRKVDFPQPDGPIRAVTMPGSIDRDTRSSTLLVANQALTLFATSVAGEVGAEPGAGGSEMGPGCGGGAGCAGWWTVVMAPPRGGGNPAG